MPGKPPLSTPSLTITSPLQHAILDAVRRYQYLRLVDLALAVQIRSLTYLQAQVKPLADANYLARLPDKRSLARGTVPWVYTLGPLGAQYCSRHGLSLWRFRPSEAIQAEFLFLTHSLARNRCLLHLEALARAGQIRLEGIRHEWELPRLRVTIARNGQSLATSWRPDGFFTVRGHDTQGDFLQHFALEVDMGTMDQTAWREKVRKIVAVYHDPAAYAAAYGVKGLTIAVIVAEAPGIEKRVADLTAWTAAELTEAGGVRLDRWFFLTGGDPAALTAAELYLAQAWRQPGGSCLVHLWEGVAPDTRP